MNTLRRSLATLLLGVGICIATCSDSAASESRSYVDGSRMAAVSAQFLGKPYKLDPLGEGPDADVDTDPLWRTDAFDCLTFVETVIALARSGGEHEAQQELQRLRYAGGQVSFGTRNHFPDADWIPNNLQAGTVADVTASIAEAAGLKDRLALARGVVRRAAWLRGLPNNPLQATNPRLAGGDSAALEALRRLAAGATDQVVALPYLRLREASKSRLARLLTAMPDGAVIFIVRPNSSLLGRVGAVTQISHVGLALRNVDGLVVYRNASSGRARRIVDQPLLPYLQRSQHTRSFAGIVILRAVTPPVRAQMP